MLADRNLTVHTYKEALAAALYPRLAGHRVALIEWLAAVERRLAKPARR